MGEGTWPGTSELGRPGGYPRATRLLPLGRALSFPAWAGRTFGTALERHPVNLRPSTELPCLRALLGLGSTRPKSGPREVLPRPRPQTKPPVGPSRLAPETSMTPLPRAPEPRSTLPQLHARPRWPLQAKLAAEALSPQHTARRSRGLRAPPPRLWGPANEVLPTHLQELAPWAPTQRRAPGRSCWDMGCFGGRRGAAGPGVFGEVTPSWAPHIPGSWGARSSHLRPRPPRLPALTPSPGLLCLFGGCRGPHSPRTDACVHDARAGLARRAPRTCSGRRPWRKEP